MYSFIIKNITSVGSEAIYIILQDPTTKQVDEGEVEGEGGGEEEGEVQMLQ